uniref:Elongation of very long chain fatty acids protein n=1 Tax=Gasterosteus aculeatus aculeatus TaxID=481459 RepID=A0AAQ4RIW1_GASAC
MDAGELKQEGFCASAFPSAESSSRCSSLRGSKAFMFCGLYAALVFGGQHFMRERPKLNLRRPLMLWSLSLAVFSIIGALRTGSYMLHILTASGFRQSVCDNSFYSAPVSKFWAYAFVLSKAPELGDTVFIILRKQRLIFLHWYHHITVLLYSWYSYKDQVGGAAAGFHDHELLWSHSLMYTYYAARAAGLRVPPPLRHDHHGHPDPADGHGPGRAGPCVPLDARDALPVQHGQHRVGLRHVPQLLGPLRFVLLPVLPRGLLRGQRVQGRVAGVCRSAPHVEEDQRLTAGVHSTSLLGACSSTR